MIISPAEHFPFNCCPWFENPLQNDINISFYCKKYYIMVSGEDTECTKGTAQGMFVNFMAQSTIAEGYLFAIRNRINPSRAKKTKWK